MEVKEYVEKLRNRLTGKHVEISEIPHKPPFIKVILLKWRWEKPAFFIDNNGKQKWVETIYYEDNSHRYKRSGQVKV